MNYDSLVQGVDCSHWNGAISWSVLADAGIRFAYIKATQGLGEDPQFQTNAANADKAGILTLAYPFVGAGDTSAAVEKFESVVGPTMPAVLDCEVSGISSAISTWIAGLGSRPMLAYVGMWPPFTPPPELWTLPRILPEYAAVPRLAAWDGVSSPDWSKEWLIWQRSQQGTFTGEMGNFDLDVLAVSFDQFKRWCSTGSFAQTVV